MQKTVETSTETTPYPSTVVLSAIAPDTMVVATA